MFTVGGDEEDVWDYRGGYILTVLTFISNITSEVSSLEQHSFARYIYCMHDFSN